MLHYRITPHPLPHQWHITLSFISDGQTPIILSLPNWVPGSYLIRDFSRHIISINAECSSLNESLKPQQIDKNHWQLPAIEGKWQIHYTVYAFDLSVRGSYLDTQRGFFDGAALFLTADTLRSQPHQIEFHNLPNGWDIATAMPSEPLNHNIYTASCYDELIDYPFELGHIEKLNFTANNIPHTIALSGHYSDFDRTRLLDDLQRICTTQLNFFGNPAPFKKYLFLLHVGDKIYGGLEHRNSTALLADRNSLPRYGTTLADDAYTQLLGLFSHEYFHAWNVKSIKPAVFQPYNLNQENYTEQLWAFEGITSYYDDLMLVRSHTITPESYLKLLASNISRVWSTPGRLKQTLAESSFSAWHKFYKQNENSPNALISYYQQGALAALCLDLTIRLQSAHTHSLDTVMQALYQHWLRHSNGIQEQEWQQLCQQFTNLELNDFFHQILHTTEALPLIDLFAQFGISLSFQNDHTQPWLGARFQTVTEGIRLTHVLSNTPAEAAGLSAGDTIIALNNFACTDFSQQWQHLPQNGTVKLHYFRQGYLYDTTLTLTPTPAEQAILRVTDPHAAEKWLGHSDGLKNLSN